MRNLRPQEWLGDREIERRISGKKVERNMSVNGSQNVHYVESWDGMGRSGSKVDLECNGRIASSS